MSSAADAGRMIVNGIELEVLRRGAGRPLVLLHGFDTISPRAPFLDRLGQHAEIIAPSLPGFGSSPRPPDRSEEHTSELQSRGHLVCRLLLEKKKKKT